MLREKGIICAAVAGEIRRDSMEAAANVAKLRAQGIICAAVAGRAAALSGRMPNKAKREVICAAKAA